MQEILIRDPGGKLCRSKAVHGHTWTLQNDNHPEHKSSCSSKTRRRFSGSLILSGDISVPAGQSKNVKIWGICVQKKRLFTIREHKVYPRRRDFRMIEMHEEEILQEGWRTGDGGFTTFRIKELTCLTRNASSKLSEEKGLCYPSCSLTNSPEFLISSRNVSSCEVLNFNKSWNSPVSARTVMSLKESKAEVEQSYMTDWFPARLSLWINAPSKERCILQTAKKISKTRTGGGSVHRRGFCLFELSCWVSCPWVEMHIHVLSCRHLGVQVSFQLFFRQTESSWKLESWLLLDNYWVWINTTHYMDEQNHWQWKELTSWPLRNTWNVY